MGSLRPAQSVFSQNSSRGDIQAFWAVPLASMCFVTWGIWGEVLALGWEH